MHYFDIESPAVSSACMYICTEVSIFFKINP